MKRTPPLPRPPSDHVVEEVRAALQPLSPRPYTSADAREAIHNLGRYFDILERWAIEDARTGHGPLARHLDGARPEDPSPDPADYVNLRRTRGARHAPPPRSPPHRS